MLLCLVLYRYMDLIDNEFYFFDRQCASFNLFKRSLILHPQCTITAKYIFYAQHKPTKSSIILLISKRD